MGLNDSNDDDKKKKKSKDDVAKPTPQPAPSSKIYHLILPILLIIF